MLIQPREIPPVANDMMNMLHEDEVEVVNRFHDAVIARDIDKIDELFEEVIADVEVHFATEEAMMETANYEFATIHKGDHDTMRKKLKELHERWKILKGPKEVKGFLEKDFKSWFKLHISKWDSDTAPSL
ncbi:MAG: hemerythrin family protein [Sulfurimonas sp.]|nr:hemerythrin family protein [Sulfurimonas sp.]